MTQNFMMTLPQDTYEKIQGVADVNSITVQQLLRELCNEYVAGIDAALQRRQQDRKENGDVNSSHGAVPVPHPAKRTRSLERE